MPEFAIPYFERPPSMGVSECCSGENIEIDHLAEKTQQFGDMVFSSAPMLDVVRMIRRVAPP
jgi:hypothetical protein